MYDPKILRYKTQLMQRIARAPHDGYFFFITGETHFSKIKNLIQKFVDRFQIHLSETSRVRRKKEGLANAKFFTYPIPESDNFWWLLMITDGDQPNRTSEKWSDCRVRKQRVTLWRADYELIEIPNHKQSSSWSWRYTAAEKEAVAEMIRSACRQKNKQKIIQISRSLLSAPGFSVIRKETKSLRELGYSEYLAAFGNNDKNKIDNPFHLKRLHHWVRPSKNVSFPLSTLIARAERGEPNWFPPTEDELADQEIANNIDKMGATKIMITNDNQELEEFKAIHLPTFLENGGYIIDRSHEKRKKMIVSR